MTTDLGLPEIDLSEVPDRIDFRDAPPDTLDRLWGRLDGLGLNPRWRPGKESESLTATCPHCGSGDGRFIASLVREGRWLRLKFHCYRDSCGGGALSGTLNTLLAGEPATAAIPPRRPASATQGDPIDGAAAPLAQYVYPGREFGWPHGATLQEVTYRTLSGGKTRRLKYWSPDFWAAGQGAWSFGTRMPDHGFPALYGWHEWRTIGPSGRVIWLVEGPKDADTLWALGLPATCPPGGASWPWRPEWTDLLRDRTVLVVADLDRIGMEHARKVITALTAAGIEAYAIRLPGEITEKHGRDVSDWITAGASVADLLSLAVQQCSSQRNAGS